MSMHSPSGEFLPGESHGQKSLVGYSTWGHQESSRQVPGHTHMKQKQTQGQKEQSGALRGGGDSGGMEWEAGVSRCSFYK